MFLPVFARGLIAEGFIVHLLSVGEVLWDVFNGREFLGGAPLNFSVSAQRLGNTVALFSGVGADERGARAYAAMQQLRLDTRLVQQTAAPTGAAIVTTDSSGNGTFSIDRPAAFDLIELNDSVLESIASLRPDWIYFGTLAQTLIGSEERLTRLLAATPSARRFYDVNLRHGHWSLDLVQRLSRLATIIKLNATEAETLFDLAGWPGTFSIERFCNSWSTAYGSEMICVTLGSQGCAVWRGETTEFFRGYPVKVVDTVGAGDVFSAAFLHGCHNHWLIERTACFANALGAIVSSRSGATPEWSIKEAVHLASSSGCAIPLS